MGVVKVKLPERWAGVADARIFENPFAQTQQTAMR
jgi:hypothetical protein